MEKMSHNRYGEGFNTSKEKEVKYALLDGISKVRQKEIEEYPYILKSIVLDIIEDIGEEKISKKRVLQSYNKLKNNGSSAYDVFEYEKQTPRKIVDTNSIPKVITHPASEQLLTGTEA